MSVQRLLDCSQVGRHHFESFGCNWTHSDLWHADSNYVNGAVHNRNLLYRAQETQSLGHRSGDRAGYRAGVDQDHKVGHTP
jgi:hypothetical protein